MLRFKSRLNWIMLIAATFAVVFSACKKNQQGCTDPLADNYDPTAIEDDGSCEYSNESLEVTEDISTATVWEDRVSTPGAPDYIVCSNLDVDSDLTIMPGVRIEFCSGSKIDVNSNGSITAIGTASAPIIFTGQTETPGFWDLVHINSNNPDNQFEHVTFAYGGGDKYYDNAMVWVNDNNNGQASFNNVSFENSEQIGLLVENDAKLTAFSNNSFSNNGTYGLQIEVHHMDDLDEASNYNESNGEPYISVQDGNISHKATWLALNTPFLVNGNMDIDADVTIQPGAQFRMANNASIDVNSSGSLNAIGTASNPISFQGEVESVGYWENIHINSNNPLNEFQYVEMAHGGSNNYYNYSTVWLNDNNNARMKIYNSSIRDSYGWGLYIESGTTVEPADEAGIKANNTFINNGTGSSSNCTAPCDVTIQ